MAIEFLGTSNKRIDFSTLSALQNLSAKTFIFNVNLTGATGDLFGLGPTGSTDEEFGVTLPAGGAAINKLFFYADWSTTQGQWYSTSTISTGNRQLAVTYSNSLAANVPVMYVDGQSVSVTTGQAASGTYRSGTSNSARLGSFLTGAPSVNGKILSFCFYNRILSSAEIADAYASRLVIPTYRGLVFAPNLMGAAGGVVDGASLAAGNTIVDQISGAYGVPNGSPVLRADVNLVNE